MKRGIQVASFPTPHEAELARLFLEEEGFSVTVVDSTLIGVAQHFQAALGGVKLLVPERHAEGASAAMLAFEREQQAERRAEIADDVVARAYRCSVIGLFVAPVVLHLWSFHLLSGVKDELSGRGKRQKVTALVINVAVVLFAATIYHGWGAPESERHMLVPVPLESW